jgi:hypothetical protein
MSQRWGAVGTDVADETRFEKDHYRIWIILTSTIKRGTNIVSASTLYLAECLQLKQTTVWRRMQEMIQGHIRRLPTRRGQRAQYEMLDPVYPLVKRSGKATGAAARPQRTQGQRGSAMTTTVRQAAAAANFNREELDKLLA